jgi:hypothetical protein
MSFRASSYRAIVHEDEAGKPRGEFIDFPFLLLAADLLVLVYARTPMEHWRLLAALGAEDSADAMAVTPPGIQLELEATATAFEGVDKDTLAVLRPDGATLRSHDALGWLWSRL